jgi:hypothetical protein
MVRSLESIARRVNWYTEPSRLLANVDLFLAQVMARGTTDDVIALQKEYSKAQFKKAYLQASPGLFTKRAWAYWGTGAAGRPEISDARAVCWVESVRLEEKDVMPAGSRLANGLRLRPARWWAGGRRASSARRAVGI